METAKLFFRENPFSATPSPDRYLAIGSVESARIRLMDAIDRREGPGLIVGPPGTGKTLLCSLIANAYQNRFDVVLLSETRICTRKALLQHLLHHLGLPYVDRSEGELRLSLIDRATTGGPDGRSGLMIIVDEAQTLPGRLLEELRMMSGIVRNGSPRVQLVLAGGPSLDERLAQPRMEAFSQRISARCYLHPLGQNETSTYLCNSIRRAGANPDTAIDDSTVEAVYYASSGIPRVINQTMSRAVAIAEAAGSSAITGQIVEMAWADLQQLPCPSGVNTTSSSINDAFSPGDVIATDQEQPRSVVEFGFLDDSEESQQPDLISSSAMEFTSTGRTWQSDPMAETTDYDQDAEEIPEFEADEADELRFEEASFSEASVAEIELDAASPGNDSSEDQAADSELAMQQIEEEQVEEEPGQDYEPSGNLDGLFGEGFEDEQILSFNTSASSWASPSALFESDPIDVEIERELHDDIVSINCDAMDKYPSSEVEALEDSVDLDELDEAAVDETESIRLDDFGRAIGEADIVIRDDSDMLVIEDDMDVDPVPVSLQPRGPREVDMTEENDQIKSLLAHLRDG